ncbi:MAG: hypothetical protein PGN25_21245 [Methylorubrum populi]
MILAAGAATLLACLFVATLSKGPRRPPLRLPREEAWDDDAEAVTKVLIPPQASPIDRSAPVLDAHAVGGRSGAGRSIEGPVIDATGDDPHPPAATEPKRSDAEELDPRMLDHLLDQQSRALKQAQARDDGPSEAGSRAAR